MFLKAGVGTDLFLLTVTYVKTYVNWYGGDMGTAMLKQVRDPSFQGKENSNATAFYIMTCFQLNGNSLDKNHIYCYGKNQETSLMSILIIAIIGK